MRGLFAGLVVLAVSLIAVPGAPRVALGHDAELDSLQCHPYPQKAVYHCHDGLLIGRQFASKMVAEHTLFSEYAFIDTVPFDGKLDGIPSIRTAEVISLANERVRLEGIDALEPTQTCKRGGKTWRCGLQAIHALSDLVHGQPVRCDAVGRNKNREVVAVCFVGQVDVGASMIANGWALNDQRWSKLYEAEEQDAQSQRLGMWSAEFIPPWFYRRGYRTAASIPLEWWNRPSTGLPPDVDLIQDTAPSVSAPPPVQSATPTPAARTCCKVCKKGKPCGDSCISRRYTCRKPPGCAC